MSEPGFWDDADRAQKVTQERAAAEKTLAEFAAVRKSIGDIDAAIELGQEMGEDAVADDLTVMIGAVSTTLERMELRRMLSGEFDGNNAIVAINAGAGGTESQDWAHMLFRMYLRYCEDMGWKTEILDYQDGEEAGIKGATFQATGEYAFGYLKAELGVHRLVRISPFDSQARRHTSFASVAVMPEVDDRIVIDINKGDLRIDTYRASGSGGQHVNRTDSAVRITHNPTGIVVQCQSERSQIQNRERAMKMLAARMYEEERRKREEEAARLNSEKADIGWGSQIRSYVLAPYQMVKDLRTGHESGNPQAVLDGALQPFIEAYLLSTSAKKDGDAKAF
jgi:peptide chain release factor 2